MKQLIFLFSLLCILSFASNISGQANDLRYINEKFVVKALTEINAAQATYRVTIGNGNYGSNLDLRDAGLIDSVLATGEKYGYNFVFTHIDGTPTTSAAFQVTATPQRYRKTGIRSFYTDNSGEVRGADKNGELATSGDPILDFCKIIESSNEKCVIKDLRVLFSAQMTYQATVGKGNFGSFQQLYTAGLIRGSLAIGYAHQYNFQYFYTDQLPNIPASFKITATPSHYGTSGIRSFFIDTSGILRGADRNGQQSDENDPPIKD